MSSAAAAVETPWLPEFALAGLENGLVREVLVADLRALAKDLRPLRCAEESPEESVALVRFVEIELRMVRALGERWLVTLRGAFDQQLDALILAEYDAVEAERKLAVRHLQTACGVFGDGVDALDSLLNGLPSSVWASSFVQMMGGSDVGDVGGNWIQQPECRVILRWLVASMVAMDSIHAGCLEDLAFWTHRALTASRQVKRILAQHVPRMLALRCRLKSAAAWIGWDEDEQRAEMVAWQQLG